MQLRERASTAPLRRPRAAATNCPATRSTNRFPRSTSYSSENQRRRSSIPGPPRVPREEHLVEPVHLHERANVGLHGELRAAASTVPTMADTVNGHDGTQGRRRRWGHSPPHPIPTTVTRGGHLEGAAQLHGRATTAQHQRPHTAAASCPAKNSTEGVTDTASPLSKKQRHHGHSSIPGPPSISQAGYLGESVYLHEGADVDPLERPRTAASNVPSSAAADAVHVGLEGRLEGWGHGPPHPIPTAVTREGHIAGVAQLHGRATTTPHRGPRATLSSIALPVAESSADAAVGSAMPRLNAWPSPLQ